MEEPKIKIDQVRALRDRINVSSFLDFCSPSISMISTIQKAIGSGVDHHLIFSNFYQNIISVMNYINHHGENSDINQYFLQKNITLFADNSSLYKAVSFYFWQDRDPRFNYFNNIKFQIRSPCNQVEEFLFYVYDSLSRLSIATKGYASDTQQIIEQVESNLVKIQSWIDHDSSSGLPELHLVLAELKRVQGDKAAAIEEYDRAIVAAQTREDACIAALANELAGKFYQHWKKHKIAEVYLQEAYQLYDQIGAHSKAEKLATTELHHLPLNRHKSIREDWVEALQLSQILSGSLHLDHLLVTLMEMAIEKTESDVGISILVEGDQLKIAARCIRQPSASQPWAHCNLELIPIETTKSCVLDVPQTVINFVQRNQTRLILTETTLGDYATDPYFQQRKPKSLLCLPTLDRGKLKGMIYLENYTHIHAFTPDRLEILQLLATQAAISLENAQLYARIEEYSHTLEEKVAERTQQLQQEIQIRTQTETALRASENRYKTLFENSALQLWELDLSGMKQYFNCILATGIQDFHSFFRQNPHVIFQCLQRLKVLRVNPATYLAFGANSEAEFLANLNPITLFSQDFNVLREAMVALAQGKQHFKSEFRYQRPDGTWGYTLLHLDVARGHQETLSIAILSAIEISDHKQIESELKESESKYRALVEASQDAIWSVNDHGCYTFVNPAVQRIYGYDPEDFIGRSIADFAPPPERDRLRAEFDRLLLNKTFFQQEIVHQTRDGKPIHLLLNGIVRRNHEGHILGATGTASNITDRKQAEIELQRAKELADKANRAKSEFLANMSHELRTPLNAILGFTQVMNRDATLSTEHQKYLQIISQSGEHLLDLINNILEMSKIESGRLDLYETQFDLYRLLNTLEGMFQLKAKQKGLWLIFEKTPDVPQYIQSDERKLHQILINLLSNSIKFTQNGGVTLRVSVSREKGATDNHSQTPNPKPLILHFQVEDTGIGIKPEELDTLFLPFAQAEAGRKAIEGTGLGLAISRRFAQLMGGDLTVCSTVGQGSCFQMELTVPSIEKTMLPTDTLWRQPVSIAPEYHAYRILIADDRPESRLRMVQLMTSLGLQVREAKNGQEAVVLWETWRPHLIWMDMQMPGRDGYHATQQIKARSCFQEDESAPKSKIVALTASTLESERTTILSSGGDDVVSKPFRDEIILEKLAQHLGVRYCVAESITQTPGNRLTGNQMPTLESLRAQLSHLPYEWMVQSYQAAIKGSDRILLELIDQLPPTQGLLATVLKDWVSHFRFDRVIELLKPITEAGQCFLPD